MSTQKLIIKINTNNTDYSIDVEVEFKPYLSKNKNEFDKLPVDKQKGQNIAKQLIEHIQTFFEKQNKVDNNEIN